MPARRQALIDALGERLDRRADFPQPVTRPRIRRIEAGSDQRGEFVIARGEFFVQGAASADDRLFDRRELALDQARQRLALRLDPQDGVLAALDDGSLECRQSVLHRRIDDLRVRIQRQIDRGVMPHGGVLEIVEVPARRLVDTAVEVGHSLVEFAAAVRHDRVDRLDMGGDAVAECARVNADPVDHESPPTPTSASRVCNCRPSCSVLSDKAPTRAPPREAIVSSNVVSREVKVSWMLSPLNEIAATASLAVVANLPPAYSAASVQCASASRARSPNSLLGRAALGVDRLDGALGYGVDLAADRVGALVERRSQLRLPRREMLGPVVVGGIESRACILRALGDLRSEAIGGQPYGVLQRLTAHDDRFVQPIGHLVQAGHQVLGAFAERFRERAAARLDAVQQALAAFVELVGDRMAGLGELARYGLAVEADRLRRLCAARGRNARVGPGCVR